MRVVVSDLKSWKKKIDVEVPFEEVKVHLDGVYSRFQKKIRLDGFRQGKVPMGIIRKQFGDAIKSEAAEELMQIFFKKAVQDEKLAVVAPATVQDIHFDEEKPFTFIVEVEVRPEVEVRHYRDFKLEKETVRVVDEDVDRSLEMLQQQRTELKPSELGARHGNLIEGDVQAVDVTGVPILGKKWENRIFELGGQPLGEYLEDQLRGVKPGDERMFRLPQENREGANPRDESYAIRVKAVHEKIVPEIDDAFAKSLGSYETLQALREEIRGRLESQRSQEAEEHLQHSIADEIIRRNDFELPPSMVETTLDRLWEDAQKGKQELDEAAFKEENRPHVVWNLKWNLLQAKIAELERLSVEDAEVENEIEQFAKQDPENEKKIRIWFKQEKERERLKDKLLDRKIMTYLRSQMKIKEVSVKPSKKKNLIVRP